MFQFQYIIVLFTKIHNLSAKNAQANKKAAFDMPPLISFSF